jgi:hypothetical protein
MCQGGAGLQFGWTPGRTFTIQIVVNYRLSPSPGGCDVPTRNRSRDLYGRCCMAPSFPSGSHMSLHPLKHFQDLEEVSWASQVGVGQMRSFKWPLMSNGGRHVREVHGNGVSEGCGAYQTTKLRTLSSQTPGTWIATLEDVPGWRWMSIWVDTWSPI